MSHYKIRRCWCGKEPYSPKGRYCLEHRPKVRVSHKDRSELNGFGLGLLHGDKFFEAFDNAFGLKPIEVNHGNTETV